MQLSQGQILAELAQREERAKNIVAQIEELEARRKNVQPQDAIAIGLELDDLRGELSFEKSRISWLRAQLARFEIPGKGVAMARTRVQRADRPEGWARKAKPKPKRDTKTTLRSGVRGKPPVKFVILASARV